MAPSSFPDTVWVASCHDFSRPESRSHRDIFSKWELLLSCVISKSKNSGILRIEESEKSSVLKGNLLNWFLGLKSDEKRPHCIKSPCDFTMSLQIADGPEGCLDSIGNVDLFEDAIQMVFHRMRTDAKFVSNFIIGSPHGNQRKYFDLSLAEVFHGAFCRFVLASIFKNAFGHYISGKPQFSINDGFYSFKKNVQWVMLIKKPCIPSDKNFFSNSRSVVTLKRTIWFSGCLCMLYILKSAIRFFISFFWQSQSTSLDRPLFFGLSVVKEFMGSNLLLTHGE